MKERLDVAYIFISHDLATVVSIADRVVVMYAGCICEEGPTGEVFSPPHHPYTALLISSVPELRHDWLSDVLESRDAQDDLGSVAFPVDKGCAFRTRCPLVVEGLCESVTPPALALGDHGQNIVYCHRDIETLTAAAEQ